MKISKKMLALVLTVAMLVSCMVFSFSADAAVTKMWWNDFEGEGTATSPYGGMTDNGDWNSGRKNDASKQNYSYIKQDTDGNDYMALGFNNYAANTATSGFRVAHADETVKNGTGAGTAGAYTSGNRFVNGKFMLTTGKYVLKFNYRLDSISATNTDGVDIALLTRPEFYWNAEVPIMAGGAVTSNRYPTTVLATLTKADVSTEWRTVIYYLDYEGNGAELHLLARRHADGKQDSLTGTEVGIDNIEIYRYEDASDFPTVNYNYGGTVIGTSTGLPGVAYTIPALTGLPTNAEVSYWADADFTIPATIPTVYPDTSMDIYVKAETYLSYNPWTVESETVGSTVSGKPAGRTEEGGTTVVSNKYAHSGSQSIEIQCAVGYTRTAARNMVLTKDGSGNTARTEVGKSYLLSYWVLIPTSADGEFHSSLGLLGIGDDLTLNSRLASGNDVANANRFIYRDSNDAAADRLIPNDGRWHQVICYVDGANIKSAADNGSWGTNAGNMLFSLTNYTANENLRIYVDDIDLIPIDKLAAADTSREQYLFGETVNNQLTHLHKHSAKKDDGIYTSVRLGATYTAGQAAGSIVLGGVELPLVERGIVVADATNAATLSVGTNKWKSSKTSGFDTVWETNGKELTYTLRLANISKTLVEAGDQYVYRSYFKVTVPCLEQSKTAVANKTLTTYGETSTAFSFNDIYTDCTTAPGYAGGVWFD